jgi:hypothetical protein
MVDYIRYANQGATRSMPLSQDLVSALEFLPELGVQAEVFSGGQPAQGSGGARVGSTRHDLGGAADVFFYKDGRRLDWANPEDQPVFSEIVRRGRERGLTGFGAGPDYMQPGSMHIGFGNPAVWGAGGRGANAPDWLRQAYYGAEAPQGGTNMARQPQPVSGTPTMSTQGQAAPQAEEEKVPFFQRPGVGNALDSLAIALQGMTIDPNEGLMQLSANRIAGRREQAQTKAQQNRTADWLESQGMTAAAQGVRSGAIGARDALAMARGQQQDPYSSIGKLQSDLAAGRISQEQYEIALQSMAPSNTSIEVGPDGQLRFVQGPGAQAKPFTEGQSKDNIYVTRAQGAIEVLDPVADELVSAASRAANVDPTGFIRSRIQSPEFQVAQQAGNEFLQAILRKDTGAAITEQEQRLYGQTYLPQPGDSPQVLTEKKAARRRAIDAIRAGMSPAQLIAVERGLSQGQSSNGGGQANAPQSGGDGFSVTGVID